MPAERTFSYMAPVQLDRPLFRMPVFATMCAGCASLCLGIAQAATDALLELGASKVQEASGLGLQDRPSVQALVALVSVQLDAARLLLHDAQRARVWSGAIHAARTAKAAVTSIYEAAGTSSLYNDCPIDRAHRDIHAIAQHIILGQVWLENAGRVRFGLQPSHPLF